MKRIRSFRFSEASGRQLVSFEALRCVLIALMLSGTLGCRHAQDSWTPPPIQKLREPRGVNGFESVAFFPQDDLSSRASPNGRYVAFVSAETGNLDIWVRDYRFDSTYPVSSHPSDDYDPAISSDGLALAFVSRRADAKGDLYLTKLEDSEAIRLTDESTQDRQPVFSPDGKSIYYTSADPAGLEFISVLHLKGVRPGKRISPTPGFDPALDSSGDYLVYTAPRGVSGRDYPHLVALRLSDNATVAITRDDAPAGFATIENTASTGDRSVFFVRFPDDDTADGIIDGQDKASIWKLSLDFEKLFRGELIEQQPIPLTDGSMDELFPDVQGEWLYHTRTIGIQQDIVRIPVDGLFPNYANAEDYLRLGDMLEDERERWFAYRSVVARTKSSELLRATALARIAELHQERLRPDLAKTAWGELAQATQESELKSSRDELHALALVELAALERIEELKDDPTRLGRDRSARKSRQTIERIRDRYRWSNRVLARLELENAEVLLGLNKKSEAIAALDLLAKNKHKEDQIAVRAMVRRAELFESISEPEVLGRVYSNIIRRFPKQTRWADAAAKRIIDAYRKSAKAFGGWRKEVEAIRRVVARTDVPVVRMAGRTALAQLLIENGQQSDALQELKSLVDECSESGARIAGYRGLQKISELQEAQGQFDEAIDTWLRIEKEYASLPQALATARESRTQLNLKKASREEEQGNRRSALQAYQAVIEVDFSQTRALRRYVALSASLGKADQVLTEFSERARRSPRTPMARYAHALALTWVTPPRLEAARLEIDEAIELNPQFIFAYITRGWIWEMLELSNPTADYLERAITDYSVASRLNNDADDPQTQSEINLNLSNARFRLGVRANDMGNIDSAFRLYLDRMRAPYRFENPSAELVFWERLGRAAAWKEEWAISAMATQEALELVSAKGLVKRKAQLLGNLALSYSQAEEHELAAEAFRAFREEIRTEELETCRGLIDRNRAVQHILLAQQLGSEGLSEALLDLAKARSLVEATELCRPPIPSIVNAPKQGTRAPYGFDQLAELDLNLAWAENAHRLKGEAQTIQEIRALRSQVLEEILDSPKILTTDMRKEAVGLVGGQFRNFCRRGLLKKCLGKGTDLFISVMESSFTSGIDLQTAMGREVFYVQARTLSLLAEELSILPEHTNEDLESLHGKVESALIRLEQRIVAFLVQWAQIEPEERRVPAAESIRTLVLDMYERTEREGQSESETFEFGVSDSKELPGVIARLYFALGLLEKERAQQVPLDGQTFEEVFRGLAGLDQSIKTWDRNFRRSRDWAALGSSKLALNLLVRGRTELGVREVAKSNSATTTQGRTEILSELYLRRKLPPGNSLAESVADFSEFSEWVEGVLPIEIDRPWDDIVDSLIATATTTNSQNANRELLARLDKALVLGLGMNQPLVGTESQDAGARQESMVLSRKFERYTHLLRQRESSSEPGFSMVDLEALQTAERELTEAIELVRDSAVAVRNLGRSFEPDEVLSQLARDEAMLVPFRNEGQLSLLFVDGSTTADSGFVRVDTQVPFEVLKKQIWGHKEALRTGRSLQPDAGANVWNALLEPVRHRLKPIKTLILCDEFLGGPIPRAITPRLTGISLVHASSPSSFVAARERRIYGAKRNITLIADDEELEGRSDTIRVGQLATVKRGTVIKKNLISRRSTLERLYDVPSSVVTFDNVVEISDFSAHKALIHRPGRQTLGNIFGLKRGLEAIAQKSKETYLEDLRLPAKVWIFSRAKGDLSSLLKGYELASAMQGTPTLIVIPAEVPEESRKRVLNKFLTLFPKLSAAEAIGEAIREEMKETPMASLIFLLGDTGMSSKLEARDSRRRLKKTERRVVKALRRGDRPRVIQEMELLRGLQRASRKSGRLKPKRTFEILVTYLKGAKRLGRAADVQQEFINYNLSANRKLDAARGWVALADIYSLAQDVKAALLTYEQAIDELSTLKDDVGLAQAHNRLGLHHRRQRKYVQAAEAFERAAKIYERKDVFSGSDKRLVTWSKDNLRGLSSTYMNQLADSARAKTVYRRWLGLVKTDQQRVEPMLGLARVSRREGDFREALNLANRTRQLAKSVGDRVRELEAIVEGANVAWYQGDYVVGRELCEVSLRVADENIAKEKLSKRPKLRRYIKGKIYSLSVCGLLNMSTNRFDAAKANLLLAAELARTAGLQTELAIQFNNLGRVYLEFGQYPEAIRSFRKALSIDQRLADKFGIAYDLRNLGAGLALQGASTAEQTLTNALTLAKEVSDKNNELRTLFELGELYRKRGQANDAKAAYEQAKTLAQNRKVKELLWKIHRALGLLKLADEDRIGAEEDFSTAVRIVEEMSTRSGNSDFGVSPYAAFDDLMILLIEQDRLEEAFAVLERGRVTSHVDVLSDRRIQYFDQKIGPNIQRLRESKTATVVEQAARELRALSPGIATMTRIADADVLAEQLAPEQAVVLYRLTYRGLIIFVLDEDGLQAEFVASKGKLIRNLIREYGVQMTNLAEMASVNAELSKLMIEPIREQLANKKEVAVVLNGLLRYIAIPALFYEGSVTMLDKFVTFQALAPANAVQAFRTLNTQIALSDLSAFRSQKNSSGIPFSAKEIAVLKELFPEVDIARDGAGQRQAFREALSIEDSVVHFAGHFELSGQDSIASEIQFDDGEIKLYELLQQKTNAELVVLSSCESRIGAGGKTVANKSTGKELLSLSETMLLAGARTVLASVSRVNDVAAAVLMKRFYRALKKHAPAVALREARKVVKQYHPHPAWWANFTYVIGQPSSAVATP